MVGSVTYTDTRSRFDRRRLTDGATRRYTSTFDLIITNHAFVSMIVSAFLGFHVRECFDLEIVRRRGVKYRDGCP